MSTLVNTSPPQQPAGFWQMFMRPFSGELDVPDDLDKNRFQSLVRGSALNFGDQYYRRALTDPSVSPAGKAGYVAGRFAYDLVNDGSRVPWWLLNHPMAQTAVAADITADAAGLNPDYGVYRQRMDAEGLETNRAAIDARFAEDMGFSHGTGADAVRGAVPLNLARKVPAIAGAAALLGTSGNSDFFNIAGGGRIKGYEAVLPVEGDKTQSSNPLLELGARYLFGRTGRVLPWEDFTLERPDVSPSDYGSYRAHQFDSGPLLGVFKATSRNIDAEPEFTMMGFRVPLSSAATTGGALIGGIAGANVLDGMINAEMGSRFGGALKARGNRRLAGFALGALAGAGSGNLSAQAVNNLVIQPTLNPEAVAAAAAWQQEQRQKGLL